MIIRCADRDLHSGIFGGAAANPAHVISRIIAALHDSDGRIMVPGFYEGVSDLPPDVKASLAGLGLTEQDFLGGVGLKHSVGEKGGC